MTSLPSRMSLFTVARSSWSWWIGELLACVPARFRVERRRRLDGAIHLGRDLWTVRDRRGSTRSVDPRDSAAVAEVIDDLKGRRRQAKVSATVPLSRCFVRRTELPRAMMRHAASVLASELDAATPFAGGSAHWDWYVHGPGSAPGTLGVTQVVLKRRDTEALLDRLSAAGVVLASVGVEDDTAAPPRRVPVNLLRNDRGVSTDRQALRKARRILAVAAGLACLAIVPTAFSQQASTLATLDQDLADAKDAVAPRAGLARAPLEALGTALQTKRIMPSSDLVLDRLAAILPTGSSLDHLFLDKDVLTIQGRTTSVRDLERALSTSPLFSAGHNTAAVAGAGDAPFTIRLKLKPMPAAPEA